MEPIISLKQLTHIYSPNTPFEQRALDQIDLDIHPGEYLGIIGRTGSGKSTLIQMLNGLLRPTEVRPGPSPPRGWSSLPHSPYHAR